ncbi:TIR domain-containing protein [Flavobacterium reichenbachii]|uniref:Molecular chaperone Tir n=1 Tax=Flavobacterium reichenbachii TaxID=362418 RepID=A0A085ZM88_9FLAO|nr:TIR domain-containing protein [Flavobacterium reichenbachii]KFF05552.1 molecular chaperone Tir [Flavobacterium reichenbachii]OXB17887.1 molecular chaperone Tir [Flavobacterium reichenbachii]
MAYTACYTCFDGDTDMHYYNLMKAWHKNGKFNFRFDNVHDLEQVRDTSTEETIKRSLRRRLNASDVFVVLIGRSTRYLYKFVRWEIEVAIDMNLPIIAINLDNSRAINYDLCPPILRDTLAIHVPFSPDIVNYAITNWPYSHRNYRSQGVSGSYHYYNSVYSQLGY